MKFTNREPTHWRDLQSLVAKYLNEADYKAITSHEIDTVRGKVEVDVFVQADTELGKTVLCECKFWNTNIPKEKVHAFRTVILDSGASLGIIISKRGFQKGAIEAAKNANIELKTWDEFLSMIYEKWLTSRLISIKRKRIPLGIYMDPMTMPGEKLSIDKQNLYFESIKHYSGVDSAAWMITKNDFFQEMRNFYKVNEFDTAEEYIDYLFNQIDIAIEYYKILFNGIDIPESTFDVPDAYTLAFL